MKKIISLVLVAVLTLSAVIGCSGGTTSKTSASAAGGSGSDSGTKK